MRIIIYLLIFYFIYKVVKYFLKKKNNSHTQEEYYTYDEYGNLRKEKDITNQVRIISEKNLTEKE